MDTAMSRYARASLDPTEIAPRDFDHYRALWQQAERLELLTAHPLHLDLELTSRCNLRCAMCWQSGELTAPMGFMADDLFKRLVDDGLGRGLAAIKLQIRGESTLHPHIAELAGYAKRAGVLDVQLTTNGTILGQKPRVLDGLLQSGLDKLIFSIDPAHDQSAVEIYGAERAPDVRRAVADTMAFRGAHGLGGPKVRIQTFVLGDQTAEQRLAEVQADFPDVDEYIINPLWNSKWDEDSIAGLATDYDLLPCSYLWTRLAVFWNGAVHLCCRDYNGLYPLGDAHDSDVGALWLGQVMMDIRRAHLAEARGTVPICKNCDVCVRRKETAKPVPGAAAEPLWVRK